MTAARDDVRSALITAAAEAAREAAPWAMTDESAFGAILDALPRPLLLRFAWEGLSDEEQCAVVDAAAAVIGKHERLAPKGERAQGTAWAALDAALMTGGEDV